jgi:DNA-binding NtrC family response regulator
MEEKKKALIVEDDVCLRPLLGPIIHAISPSTQIHWVESAEDARKKLRESDYDFVIADIFLAGKNTGIQLWKDVDETKPDLPFVLMSGLPYFDFLKTIGQSEVAPPYLEKPLQVGSCRQLLQAIMKPH